MGTMEIVSVNTGRVALLGERRGRQVHSGIRKAPVNDTHVYLHATGLEGDEQADHVVHGAVNDKTVYVYPRDHYALWVPEMGTVLVPGPRSPCAKLDMLRGEGTAAAMMRNAHCGWYFKVVTPGLVPTTGDLELDYRPTEGITIAARFREKARRKPTIPDIRDED